MNGSLKVWGGSSMSDVLVGTSGWSYDDWQNVVYPPGVSSRFDRLKYLANLCDTIEVNSSFYHIPNRRTIDSWLSRVSDLPKFLFSAKLFKGLTHERNERTAGQFLSEYINSIDPIRRAGRLAAVLMQFPWSFKFNEENLRWIDLLAKKLSPLPLAVEVRHTSWLNDEYLDYLRLKKIAFCNIDQPLYNTNIPPTHIVTAPFSYVRFHGRNFKHWFTENEDASQRYNYHYKMDELAEWVEKIRKMAAESQRVYIYMNNHISGQGLANGLELKSLLTGEMVPAPRPLILAFPELQNFTTVLNEGSGSPTKSKRSNEDTNLLF
jgi:uncharacterized protein YecE (DUF72 family)